MPPISVSISAVKHYDPNATGTTGLFMMARVYTSIGSTPVTGRSITVHVSYIYGGVTFTDSFTLGPTDAQGYARACPARQYPAGAQLQISTDPVENGSGPPGPGFDDVQVQNQARTATPSFCR